MDLEIFIAVFCIYMLANLFSFYLGYSVRKEK